MIITLSKFLYEDEAKKIGCVAQMNLEIEISPVLGMKFLTGIYYNEIKEISYHVDDKKLYCVANDEIGFGDIQYLRQKHQESGWNLKPNFEIKNAR